MANRRREAEMRSFPRLGQANVALAALYFVPVWGVDAIRALKSPFSGFEDRVHGTTANFLHQVFGFGLDGLVWTSNVLAGVELVAVAGLVAYVIEFARSIVIGREVDRATLDAVLALAVTSIALSAVPALALNDAGLVRLYATQILLVTGAFIVILIERQIEQTAEVPASRVTTAERERALANNVISDAAGASLRRAA
jgi:hypothetical protein